MAFSESDVIGIMSADHRRNTAYELQKPEAEITSQELIRQWSAYHIQMLVMEYKYRPRTPREIDEEQMMFV